MDSVWDIIYLRRPAIDYVSPPVCEVIFSGSSNPIIILSNTQRGKVTGLELGGFSGFRLSWNVFPGAICYNIYFIGGDDIAVLLAECVQPGYELPSPGPGPGRVVVTPITPDDGEGDPSDPIPYPTPGGGGTSTIHVEALCVQAARNSFPGTFMIGREAGDTIGNLVVNFTMSGEAVNGVDYDLIPLSATIPNGSEFVIVDIAPVEAVIADGITKTVRLTLSESFTYAVSEQNTDVLVIRPPYVRIVDFGGTQPLWTVSPDAEPSDYCDWDGTWNFLSMPGGTSVFKYQSPNGQVSVGTDIDGNPLPMDAAISGKMLYTTTVIGPYNFPTPGTWQLEVVSRNGLDSQVVWQGLKQGGDITSPEGTYIGNGAGSDPRATLDIELFP